MALKTRPAPRRHLPIKTAPSPGWLEASTVVLWLALVVFLLRPQNIVSYSWPSVILAFALVVGFSTASPAALPKSTKQHIPFMHLSFEVAGTLLLTGLAFAHLGVYRNVPYFIVVGQLVYAFASFFLALGLCVFCLQIYRHFYSHSRRKT
jgi:hypothetical protein